MSAKTWIHAKDFKPEYVVRDDEMSSPPKSRQKTCKLSYRMNDGSGPVVPLNNVIVLSPVMKCNWGVQTWSPALGKSVFGIGGDTVPPTTSEANGTGDGTADKAQPSTSKDGQAGDVGKTSVRLTFDDRSEDIRAFRTKLEQFDKDNLNHVVANAVKWGIAKGKPLTLDAAAQMYTPIVKPAGDPRYSPSIDLKITKRHDTNALICRFVDEQNRDLTWQCIEPKTVMRAGICFSEMWFGAKRDFGVRQVVEVIRKLDPSAYPVKNNGGGGVELNLNDMPAESAFVPPPPEQPSFDVPASVAVALEKKRKAEGEAEEVYA